MGIDRVIKLTRRKALLRHFGSLKRLRAASAAEIAEVPGVGPRTAESVVAALHEPSEASGSPGSSPTPAVDPATGEILDQEADLMPGAGRTGVANGMPSAMSGADR